MSGLGGRDAASLSLATGARSPGSRDAPTRCAQLSPATDKLSPGLLKGSYVCFVSHFVRQTGNHDNRVHYIIIWACAKGRAKQWNRKIRSQPLDVATVGQNRTLWSRRGADRGTSLVMVRQECSKLPQCTVLRTGIELQAPSTSL